jgi:hypothetical protein
MGKNIELPIVNLVVEKVVYEGRYTFVLKDKRDGSESTLEIHNTFLVECGDDVVPVKMHSGEAHYLAEGFQCCVVESAFSRHGSGELRVELSNGQTIIVEDGPYENWHYIKIGQHYIHGGIGRVVC